MYWFTNKKHNIDEFPIGTIVKCRSEQTMVFPDSAVSYNGLKELAYGMNLNIKMPRNCNKYRYEVVAKDLYYYEVHFIELTDDNIIEVYCLMEQDLNELAYNGSYKYQFSITDYFFIDSIRDNSGEFASDMCLLEEIAAVKNMSFCEAIEYLKRILMNDYINIHHNDDTRFGASL